MLVEKCGVLNRVFLLDLTILSLFSLIILAVLRNVFKGVFFWGLWVGWRC
jgi:hypothetical protein